MKKEWAKKYTIPKKDKTEKDNIPFRPCAHEGCPNHAPYPAPKSRNRLRDYQYFCQEHILEFNKQWNFFDGWSADQINEQRTKDAGWDNPTWKPEYMQKMEEKIHRAAENLRGSWKYSTSAGDGRGSHKSSYVSPEEQQKRDALSVFGLQEDSSLHDIKTRYRALVKKHHPDVNKSSNAEERFKIISEAYTLLKKIFTRKDS